MSREYPDWVNPWKAAEGNRSFSGTIPIRKMRRLVPLLASDEGTAGFEAGFSRDALGWATLHLVVTADLLLTCQASLEAYTEHIERSSVLALVQDEAAADGVPEHYELAQLEEGRLVFLDVVQDELILGVPQVPRKPGLEEVRFTTDPSGRDTAKGDETRKPFAGLGDMLKRKPEDGK